MTGEVLGVIRKNRWEEIQVRAVLHEGVNYLDLRVFKMNEAGEGGENALPTGRGVTFKLHLFPALLGALEAARPYYEAHIQGEEEAYGRRRQGEGGTGGEKARPGASSRDFSRQGD